MPVKYSINDIFQKANRVKNYASRILSRAKPNA